MVDKCRNVDLKLVCIEINQTRFVRGTDNPDVVAMIKITKAFGVNFWENVVIVLTFANELRLPKNLTKEEKAKEFTKRLNEWKTALSLILSEDANIPEKIVKYIKIVPAGHYEDQELPNREYWLSDLWFECLDAMPTPEAQGALLYLNLRRFKLREEVELDDIPKCIEDQPIIVPTPEKVPTLDKVLKTLDYAAGGVTSGAAIGLAGLAAGPLGIAVGVPVGAAMGFCVGLALGVHNTEEETKKNY